MRVAQLNPTKPHGLMSSWYYPHFLTVISKCPAGIPEVINSILLPQDSLLKCYDPSCLQLNDHIFINRSRSYTEPHLYLSQIHQSYKHRVTNKRSGDSSCRTVLKEVAIISGSVKRENSASVTIC